MSKFKKKPIEVEAWLFKDHKSCFDRFKKMGIPIKYDYQHSPDNCFIPTLEGNMYISDGDWVIKGIKGEFYPCKPDIFEATYDYIRPVEVG